MQVDFQVQKDKKNIDFQIEMKIQKTNKELSLTHKLHQEGPSKIEPIVLVSIVPS